MQTVTANLGVDAGMMSIVPVELVVQGKYSKLDEAIKKMQEHPEIKALDGDLILAFRVEKEDTAHIYYDIEDDVVSLFGMVTGVAGVYKSSFASYRIKPGLYVLSDPCYVLADPKEDRKSGNYFKICETLMPGLDWDSDKSPVYQDIAVAVIESRPIPVCESGYGDGQYPAKIEITDRSLRIEVSFLLEDEEDDE